VREIYRQQRIPLSRPEGLAYVCPLYPGTKGRRIREGLAEWDLLWVPMGRANLVGLAPGEIFTLVKTKPDGFLTNRKPCIRRQNQLDHTYVELGGQGNLSDFEALL
jgi:hypothetical protein